MKKTAIASALALTASAGDVTVYGIVDMGLSVTHAAERATNGPRHDVSRWGVSAGYDLSLTKPTAFYVDAGYFEHREKEGAVVGTKSGSEMLAGIVHSF